MNTRVSAIDADGVQILTDPGDEDIVVRISRRQWKALLAAAGSYFEGQSTCVAGVLSRLQPSPSMAEVVEVGQSYERDAGEVSRILVMTDFS